MTTLELSILQTEVSRAMLAPFGHLTWTALLGGALFAVAAPPRGGFRFTKRLGWTLVGVSALHGAWDASYGWAIWVTQGLTGSGWIADWPDDSYWEVVPTKHQLWIYQAMYDGALAVIATIGVVWGCSALGATAQATPAHPLPPTPPSLRACSSTGTSTETRRARCSTASG